MLILRALHVAASQLILKVFPLQTTTVYYLWQQNTWFPDLGLSPQNPKIAYLALRNMAITVLLCNQMQVCWYVHTSCTSLKPYCNGAVLRLMLLWESYCMGLVSLMICAQSLSSVSPKAGPCIKWLGFVCLPWAQLLPRWGPIYRLLANSRFL